MTVSNQEFIEKIKIEWKRLWQERYDDKLRAEGVATQNYKSIFIERGTIIHATKDYKATNLKEIINKHKIANPERYISPCPFVGGWGKFIKNNFSKSSHKRSSQKNFLKKPISNNQHSKKGGRGWIHK